MTRHPTPNLASRRQRRLLVVLTAALIAALAAVGLFDLPRSLGVAALIGYWVVAARLDAAVGRPMRGQARLDERQRAVNDRAHRVAYQVMSVLLLASLVPAYLLDGELWPGAVVRTVPLLLLATLAITHLLLPQLILAWSEPDPVAPEGNESPASARP